MNFTVTLQRRTSPLKIVIEITGDGDSDTFRWTEISPNSDKPFFAAAANAFGYFDNKASGDRYAVFKSTGMHTDNRPAVLKLQVPRLPAFKVKDLEHCFQGNVKSWQNSAHYPGASAAGFTWTAQVN